MFLSRETSVSGNFVGHIKAAKYRFELQDGIWTSLETPSRERASSCDCGEPHGFSRVVAGFSSFDRGLRMPLVLTQGSPIFHSSCPGELGIARESLQGK